MWTEDVLRRSDIEHLIKTGSKGTPIPIWLPGPTGRKDKEDRTRTPGIKERVGKRKARTKKHSIIACGVVDHDIGTFHAKANSYFHRLWIQFASLANRLVLFLPFHFFCYQNSKVVLCIFDLRVAIVPATRAIWKQIPVLLFKKIILFHPSSLFFPSQYIQQDNNTINCKKGLSATMPNRGCHQSEKTQVASHWKRHFALSTPTG
jgi:hypothetical protein